MGRTKRARAMGLVSGICNQLEEALTQEEKWGPDCAETFRDQVLGCLEQLGDVEVALQQLIPACHLLQVGQGEGWLGWV